MYELGYYWRNTIIPFFNKNFLNNSYLNYIISIGVFFLLITIIIIFDNFLLKRLRKLAKTTDTPIDDFIIQLIEKNIFPLFYFGAFYISTRNLNLSSMVTKGINSIGVVLLAIFAIKFISSALKYWLINYVFKDEKDSHKIATIRGLFPTFNGIIWVVGVVFLLDNLGFNISAVVAGLGIGGIAIALAAQSVLGDLFSYFCMLFDHPFVVGDFIIIDDYMGTVEKIGIKTTRIRSLNGEQIIIPNTDLTGSRVRNYKRMSKRRVVFEIGVVYETSTKKLKDIPIMIKNIIEKIENIQLDRVHFKNYGNFSLNFEIVYYVLSSDYNVYMDIQQMINYAIFDEFTKKKIEFAYPTQTLYVNK